MTTSSGELVHAATSLPLLDRGEPRAVASDPRARCEGDRGQHDQGDLGADPEPGEAVEQRGNQGDVHELAEQRPERDPAAVGAATPPTAAGTSRR